MLHNRILLCFRLVFVVEVNQSRKSIHQSIQAERDELFVCFSTELHSERQQPDDCSTDSRA